MGAGLWVGGLNQTEGAVVPRADGLSMPVRVAGQEFVEAQQFKVADGRVPGGPGQVSMRQVVTAWQVNHGIWNGQVLDGLSLVLVQSIPEDGATRPFTNCYITHLATPAQRKALVNAYAAFQLPSTDNAPMIRPSDTATWRIEPAVIRFEFEGDHVVVHLGTIA
jgi:hypothetical protein